MTPTPSTYTAREVAAALGTPAATVRRRLAGVPPSGMVNLEGCRPARGWTLAALPAAMRETLACRATERRFDGPEHLLADAADAEEWVIEYDDGQPEDGHE